MVLGAALEGLLHVLTELEEKAVVRCCQELAQIGFGLDYYLEGKLLGTTFSRLGMRILSALARLTSTLAVERVTRQQHQSKLPDSNISQSYQAATSVKATRQQHQSKLHQSKLPGSNISQSYQTATSVKATRQQHQSKHWHEERRHASMY